MAELTRKYLASDIIVMATPLYVDNVSGMTKVFMDRLMIVCDPHFESDESGETRHVKTEWNLPKWPSSPPAGFRNSLSSRF